MVNKICHTIYLDTRVPYLNEELAILTVRLVNDRDGVTILKRLTCSIFFSVFSFTFKQKQIDG